MTWAESESNMGKIEMGMIVMDKNEIVEIGMALLDSTLR